MNKLTTIEPKAKQLERVTFRGDVGDRRLTTK
jgi:hypothetical protein